MNHNITLGIVAIVAATALSGVAFGIPQQVLAHSGHHNNHNSNSVKVDQQINQQNNCTGQLVLLRWVTSTVCQNFGDYQADISK
jgi:hypothetical protein